VEGIVGSELFMLEYGGANGLAVHAAAAFTRGGGFSGIER
jgi:hypothetical protein